MRRLLIRPGAIGDCILALPALEAARSDYTEVWAPRSVLPLIRFADRTRAIADTGIDLLGVREGARVPALETFDSIYSWYGAQHAEFREAVSHLPFTFFPALPPDPLGIPRIWVPDASAEDFAVLHPFASSLRKRWPLEHFRALASRLEMPVTWCAGPEEEFEDAVRAVVRKDDLYELGCWLARARIYVGNDSGIAHLAAAVGVPVVAIFLATAAAIWAPRGDHVVVLQSPSVDEAFASVSTLLTSSSARTPSIRMSSP